MFWTRVPVTDLLFSFHLATSVVSGRSFVQTRVVVLQQRHRMLEGEGGESVAAGGRRVAVGRRTLLVSLLHRRQLTSVWVPAKTTSQSTYYVISCQARVVQLRDSLLFVVVTPPNRLPSRRLIGMLGNVSHSAIPQLLLLGLSCAGHLQLEGGSRHLRRCSSPWLRCMASRFQQVAVQRVPGGV